MYAPTILAPLAAQLLAVVPFPEVSVMRDWAHVMRNTAQGFQMRLSPKPAAGIEPFAIPTCKAHIRSQALYAFSITSGVESR
jgi:hypothetical protein